MAKFQRNYVLQVQDRKDDIVTIQMPLTIEFDVVRNPLASISSASIRIFNLNETTRNRIYKDQYNTAIYKMCELRAGYGTDMPIIFRGNITRCFSQRQGVNYITTIEIYDGQYAIYNGDASGVIPKGTDKRTAIDILMRQLPNINKRVIGNYSGTVDRPMSVIGNISDLLKEFTSGGFFIDTETAYALGDGECTKGDINVINSNSGLLGSPQREETLITFDMIFEPRMKMGQLIELQSETEKVFNGQFKVISIAHRGTISESVAALATSTFKLWFGPQNLEIITS